MALRVPLRIILLSFFTVRVESFMTVVQPSSANCPREIRLKLFKSFKTLAFCALLDRCLEIGIYPNWVSLIVVASGSFTDGPCSCPRLDRTPLSCSRQK